MGLKFSDLFQKKKKPTENERQFMPYEKLNLYFLQSLHLTTSTISKSRITVPNFSLLSLK